MSRKYQPSNGTEGMTFTEQYCIQCFHCNPNPEGEKQCEILCATMMFDVNEEEYPKEWIYNKNDKPTCTKWKKWDWENDGNPDKPNNPNAPIPIADNQLMLFSITDKILIEENQEIEIYE